MIQNAEPEDRPTLVCANHRHRQSSYPEDHPILVCSSRSSKVSHIDV
jgi:hypothetical protein